MYGHNPQTGAGLQPYMIPGYGQTPAGNGAPGFVSDPTLQQILQNQNRNSAALAQQLAQIFGVRLDRNEETAWLTFDTVPAVLAIGAANVRTVMSVGQEADFVATGLLIQCTDGANPPVMQPNAIRFRIIDGSTNRTLMRNPIPGGFVSVNQAINSAGSRPWFLPKPRIFSRNSNVIFELTNVQGAQTEVDIAFFGYRIYDARALDLTSGA